MNVHRRRTLRLTALALGVLVLAAAALHGYAWWEWRATFAPGSFGQRLAAAERAAAIEPFNPDFRARPDWVRGEEFTRRNQPANAYYALHRAIDTDPGNDTLRRVYKGSYDAWAQATTWKAHVQHAREQTGGVLNEKDVIK